MEKHTSLSDGFGEMSLRVGSLLPKTDGVGIAAAMIKIGRSLNLHLEFMQSFVQDVEANFVLLEANPNKLTLGYFTIYVQGLKNSLAAIGASALSELAAVLESAGHNGDHSVIQKNLTLFREGLAELTARIGEAMMALRSEVASSALLSEVLEAGGTDGMEIALVKLQRLPSTTKKQVVAAGIH